MPKFAISQHLQSMSFSIIDGLNRNPEAYVLVLGSNERIREFDSIFAELVDLGRLKTVLLSQKNDKFLSLLRNNLSSIMVDEPHKIKSSIIKTKNLICAGLSDADTSLLEKIAEDNFPKSTYWFRTERLEDKVSAVMRAKQAVELNIQSTHEFKAFLESAFAFSKDIAEELSVHTKKTVTVLSLDGGGIRGVVPALILAEIEKRLSPKRLADYFDIIAGTSTGGILALGLSAPDAPSSTALKYRAQDLADLYLKEGLTIFPKTPERQNKVVRILAKSIGVLPHKITTTASQALLTVATKPYGSRGIEDTLKRYFSHPNELPIRFEEALSNLVVTAHDLCTRTNIIFRHNFDLPSDLHDISMPDVARSTSAAPTYFTPLERNSNTLNHRGFIDGGVFANNPAFCGYTEAKRLFPEHDCFMVSIGTGANFKAIKIDEVAGWTTGLWAETLLKTMFEAGGDCTHQNLRFLLPPDEVGQRRYYRLQVDLSGVSDSIDDASKVQDLSAVTRHAIEMYLKDDIEEIVKRLISVGPRTDRV